MDSAVAQLEADILVMSNDTFKVIVEEFPHYYNDMKVKSEKTLAEYKQAKRDYWQILKGFAGRELDMEEEEDDDWIDPSAIDDWQQTVNRQL